MTKGLPQTTGSTGSVVEREEERMFGVISQTRINMLGFEKVEVLHHRSQSKICLVRKNKKKSGARFWGSLAWHLYLMDLIERGKKEKSIGRIQGNKNFH